MPEGDTIFRAARALHRALAGTTIVRFESVSPRSIVPTPTIHSSAEGSAPSPRAASMS